MTHVFICPNCGHRLMTPDRTVGFRNEERSCEHCGFSYLFELLDDYYPAPTAAFFLCDRSLRIISCGRGSRELAGLTDEHMIGRPINDVLAPEFEDSANPIEIALEWGVRQLDKRVVINPDGRTSQTATADIFPGYQRDGEFLLVITPAK